jgi:hypothetical protein
MSDVTIKYQWSVVFCRRLSDWAWKPTILRAHDGWPKWTVYHFLFLWVQLERSPA